jgi:hypothetical protein
MQYQRTSRIDNISAQIGVKQSNENMIANVIQRLISDAAMESIRVNDLAKQKAQMVIINAMKQARKITKDDAGARAILDQS